MKNPVVLLEDGHDPTEQLPSKVSGKMALSLPQFALEAGGVGLKDAFQAMSLNCSKFTVPPCF